MIHRKTKIEKLLEQMKKWVIDAEKLRDWEIRRINKLEKQLPILKNNLSIHGKQIKNFLLEITELEKRLKTEKN